MIDISKHYKSIHLIHTVKQVNVKTWFDLTISLVMLFIQQLKNKKPFLKY